MRKEQGARVLRVLGRGLVVLVALFLVPGLEFLISARGFASYRYAPPPAGRLPAVAPPPHAPGKPTVAVVVGNAGANVADTLVPYDVLASTGKFNVYTVAAGRQSAGRHRRAGDAFRQGQ